MAGGTPGEPWSSRGTRPVDSGVSAPAGPPVHQSRRGPSECDEDDGAMSPGGVAPGGRERQKEGVQLRVGAGVAADDVGAVTVRPLEDDVEFVFVWALAVIKVEREAVARADLVTRVELRQLVE